MPRSAIEHVGAHRVVAAPQLGPAVREQVDVVLLQPRPDGNPTAHEDQVTALETAVAALEDLTTDELPGRPSALACPACAVLFLGKAEMLLSHANLFTPIDLKQRLFGKVVTAEPIAVDAPGAANPHSSPDDPVRLDRLHAETFAGSPVAQVVVTVDGQVALANRQAEALFGISRRTSAAPSATSTCPTGPPNCAGTSSRHRWSGVPSGCPMWTMCARGRRACAWRSRSTRSSTATRACWAWR